MRKAIISGSIISAAGTIVFILIHSTAANSVALALAITFGTIFYHFVMRLLVGYAFNRIMNNKANYNRSWYQAKAWEGKLYQKLKVKKWKACMPAYDQSLFDKNLHSWEEIVQATCQAELVHETIALLSLVPVIFIGCFGAAPVFIITSILAASMDLMFVMIQRYNRPRIIRVIRTTPRTQRKEA